MIVRAYQPDDIKAVLSLINGAADADKTNRLTESGFQSVWETSTDADPYEQSAVATTREGTIMGFAWWNANSRSSVILDGWVGVRWRRKGVGTALLTAVDTYVRRYGQGPVELTSRAFADLPGTAELFRLKGYKVVRQFYFMEIRLQARPSTAITVPSGIDLRSFRPTDLESLVAADNDFFSEHWGSHPRSVAVWQQQMIERRPHDPRLWTLAWANGEIVGECLCQASAKGGPNDGYVGNLGVRRDWRGRGLGRALLTRGLEKLQDAGFDTAQLGVDAENDVALALYRRVGMEIVRTRNHFSKTIDPMERSSHS